MSGNSSRQRKLLECGTVFPTGIRNGPLPRTLENDTGQNKML